MKYPPEEARCVFIDGPVAVYVSEASGELIWEAFGRLGKLVAVAALEMSMQKEANDPDSSQPIRPVPCADHDCWGSPRGAGGCKR
jgi:hypothetical protein